MNTQYLQFMQTPQMMEALINSSVSAEDANLRSREYAKMFSRNDDMREMFGIGGANTNLLQKTFSGYAETPLLSTQYFNASVASYVSSFAGYMSIERDFDQPNGLFYWFDVLGVSDMRSVVPNLGPDQYQDINTMGGFTVNVSVQTAKSYTVLTGRKLIPGTIRVKIETNDGAGHTAKYEMIDNGQGQFMAVPGVIGTTQDESSEHSSDTVVNGISYLTGKIDFTIGGVITDPITSITIVGKEDVTGTPCNTDGASNQHQFDKRFLGKMQQIALNTVPDMLVAEYNIASLGAMKKATGADMATFLFTKLRELYTKLINYKLVSTLENGYVGNPMNDLDLSNATGIGYNPTGTTEYKNFFTDYRSRVDLFDAYLVNVETALAQKAVKGVDVTAYVAGLQACNQFQKGSVIGKWERNTKMTYISDLLGWYNGIPVLRSTDIDEGQAGKGVFYAIHKTKDGQMAPLARGIYMPLTDTPTVGNYNNPTQMAAGIYYQEGTKYMAQELVQKVEFEYSI